MSTIYRRLRSAIDKEIEMGEREINVRNERLAAQTEVGRAFRAVREYRKMSLRACAKAADISAPYLSDVERGRRWMSDDTCEMLLGVLMSVKGIDP